MMPRTESSDKGAFFRKQFLRLERVRLIVNPMSGGLFPRAELAKRVGQVAEQQIYVGTSSWKYEGWLGMIYSPRRYAGKGQFSSKRFEAACLAEYAETFKTVCLDAGFYQFPTETMLEGIFSQVPGDFKLSLKVTEEITVKRYPNLPRYGQRAGQVNEHFLNADLFVTRFLRPLNRWRDQVGTLFLEFSPFQEGTWRRESDFLGELDAFLGKLPKGWDYSVELRNESLLCAAYFEVLRRHGVSHTLNSWSRMPTVTQQLEVMGEWPAEFCSARFLLKPGRTYEQAVKTFQPYAKVQEVNAPARQELIYLLRPQPPGGLLRRRFIYVNNRLEGNALGTILAALEGI